jgi:hypothetical protein
VDKSEDWIEAETLDICEPDQVTALRSRLSQRLFNRQIHNYSD